MLLRLEQIAGAANKTVTLLSAGELDGTKDCGNDEPDACDLALSCFEYLPAPASDYMVRPIAPPARMEDARPPSLPVLPVPAVTKRKALRCNRKGIGLRMRARK